MILGSTCTLMPPWGRMLPDLCPSVWLSSARYGAFNDLWRGQFCSHSSYITRHASAWLRQCDACLAGLQDIQLSRLQSVLNAAARLVFSARKHEAVGPLLRDLHWLRVPQRIKLAVLEYRYLNLTAPPYLANELYKVADIDLWRRLRLASSSTLVVLLMRHSTISDRAFPVVASHVWNSLPSSVTSSTSLTAFRWRLKAELFLRCFGPDCVWRIFVCAQLWMRTLYIFLFSL